MNTGTKKNTAIEYSVRFGFFKKLISLSDSPNTAFHTNAGIKCIFNNQAIHFIKGISQAFCAYPERRTTKGISITRVLKDPRGKYSFKCYDMKSGLIKEYIYI